MDKFDLIKSHIEAYTRKDGSVVAAHDDKRVAAQPKPASGGSNGAGGTYVNHQPSGTEVKHQAPMSADAVKQHAVAAGAKYRTNVSAFSSADAAHSFAARTVGAKGGAFVMKHPDHGHHVVVGGADSQRMEKNGYKYVSGREQPEAQRTGSDAPARMTNIGSKAYPLMAKTSGKLDTKHHDGSTHHVGGYQAPSDGKGDHLIQHDGKAYSFTGKSGKNIKTGEDSHEFVHHGDDGERRAWVTKSGHLMND